MPRQGCRANGTKGLVPCKYANNVYSSVIIVITDMIVITIIGIIPEDSSPEQRKQTSFPGKTSAIIQKKLK